MASGLETEVQFVKGVGPRLAPFLNKLGIHTVKDLIWHVPRRYEDRSHLPPLRALRPGDAVTVRGELVAVESRALRGGRVLLRATISDGTGEIALNWFNQPWIRTKLTSYHGEIIAYGSVKEARWGYEMSPTEYELIEEGDDPSEFGRIVPVYPATEGLFQKQLRRMIRTAIDSFLKQVEDPLPEEISRKLSLRDLRWSLRQIHEPDCEEHRLEARKRLVFEEFLSIQLALQLRRMSLAKESGISFPISNLEGSEHTGGGLFVKEWGLKEGEDLWDEVHRMLPFTLTNAQKRTVREIWADMERPHPMNRLVQGDVGSGKTAVAACAMLAAVRCGYQTAMMAPTEILAEQHFVNLHSLFAPLDLRVALMVGKQSAAEKKRSLRWIESGEARIAVGTHAMIQEGVKFQKLGLAIVDEQHRFGVMQRAALRSKGNETPDTLVMTATPIPRTLTMAIFGDLDVSIIDELPPGRKPIKTHWRAAHRRSQVYATVRELVREGRQAYFVCPMISESEKMQTQAAQDLYYRLSELEFSDLRVGLLHGQLKAAEKEDVMGRFRQHELDILVSTVVIEVGVDVPNASVMIIEDANRFGLAQLHQLRGRVGRGEHQSYCILIADASSDDAQARLKVLEETTDGFRIAEEDLRLRGPGEVMGTRQSGQLEFKVGDLIADVDLMELARRVAVELLSKDPDLRSEANKGLRKLADEAMPERHVMTVG